METFNGKTVLITGGASGIGKIMGRMALQKGARLIIWDIDRDKTGQAESELSQYGKVSSYIVDVSDLSQIKSTAKEVLEKEGTVDILINNAGIVVGKYFHEHSHKEIESTMAINSSALMHITLEFLPAMIERNSGHICNIASSAGLTSNPKMSVYVASKWAATGWSDSLRLEMKYQKRNIAVTTVTPYYIDTGMFEGVRSLIPILKPETAARKIIRGIERKKIFVSMPWSVRFVRLGQALMPVCFFDWFIGNVVGIYKTMDHFKGHEK